MPSLYFLSDYTQGKSGIAININTLRIDKVHLPSTNYRQIDR